MTKKRIDLRDCFTYDQLIWLATSMELLKQRYMEDDLPDDYKAALASQCDTLYHACFDAAVKLGLADGFSFLSLDWPDD